MPSSNRSTHYHRFIPSEEVQEVSAWEFRPVDGSEPPPKAGADEPPPEPTITPEDVAQVREQAFAEGFEQGRQAGAEEARKALEAPLKQHTQQQAQRVTHLLTQAQADMDALQDTLAAQLLELACDLARQVVRRELASPLEPLRAVVQEALALAVEDGRPATLRLHPDDAAALLPDMAATLEQLQVKCTTDATLTPGGCTVESAQGAVDATVEKRWSRAVANLGLNVPWAPGEQADV